jgi:hypothetical protein
MNKIKQKIGQHLIYTVVDKTTDTREFNSVHYKYTFSEKINF